MLRLAIFTDTFDEVNGVTTIYRRFVAAAEAAAMPAARLAVFCAAERNAVESGRNTTIFRFRPRPRLALPRYNELHTGLAPEGAMRRAFLDWQLAHGPFDAVIVATPAPVGYIGWQLARRHELPLVGFYHTRFPAYLGIYSAGLVRSTRLAAWVERLGYEWMRTLYDNCELVICQSQATAAEVCRVTHGDVAVWDTGVDLAHFGPGKGEEFRSRWGISPDAVVVAYVGRLAPEKNLDGLAALSRQLTDLHFLIVGDGPYADVLRVQARATITGYLHGAELAEAYQAADIFFFPSNTDTFGNVLLEALATGLPLVVVDGGPGADLLARCGAGLTYPDGNLEAAAAALRQLASSPSDREAMAKRALDHVATRGWDAAFRQFVMLCQQVVDQAGEPMAEAEAV